MHSLTIINIAHQSGTFVTVDESTLTDDDHQKYVVYLRVHSWCCTLYGFDKCIMTCIYHYSIIQSIFTALEVLCAMPIHPSFPLNPWQPLIFLLSP